MSDANRILDDSPRYWRSLGELESSEEFVRHLEAEFPDDASVPVEGMSRRRFLSLMAASAALVGMSGCRWPREEIIPFGKRPESYHPGRVKRFATTFTVGEAIKPVLVTSYDGRPIKVEGARQGSDLHSQAEILSLYDPDRSKSPRRKVEGFARGASWAEFESELGAELARGGGEGLAVLLPDSASAVLAFTLERAKRRHPRLLVYRHEPVSRVALREGLSSLGSGGNSPFEQIGPDTRVIVDLGAGLLTTHPRALANAAAFAAARKPGPEGGHEPPRLYCFEAGFTPTGATADHRAALPSRDLPIVLALVGDHLLRHDPEPRLAGAFGSELRQSLARLPLDRLAQRVLEHREIIDAMAEDLLAHRRQGLLCLGPDQPRSAHALCFLINGYLTGSVPVDREAPMPFRPPIGTLEDLVARMRAGEIRTLLILGGNPVYDAPADLDFAGALAQVGTSMHLGLRLDETGLTCDWHLPMAHALESWDQLRTRYLQWYSVQPLSEPLYGGRTPGEILSILAFGQPVRAYDLSRAAFQAHFSGSGPVPDFDPANGRMADFGPEMERRWRKVLHEGIAHAREAETEPTATLTAPSGGVQVGQQLSSELSALESPLGPDHLELVLAVDAKLHDGRFANNGWLQELPDPVTKLTWDNALMLSPALAEEKGLQQGDMVELRYRGRSLEVPVYVQPGQARYSVTLNLGYGRSAAGNVGDGVGFNAYLLRTSDAPWGGVGATIVPTGRRYTLACTQDHHAIDTRGYEERELRSHALIREGSFSEYHEHPEFAQHLGVHHPALRSLWEERGYDGHKWGMSVDLNACTGCSACVVACQAENNIPVVGKDEVKRGREMQWMRIDRYFSGDPAQPEMASQPMACVHCEMAPCEQVCPVAATMHNAEGLNVMVYNRCVGTRYCSNNCPYKVRRFNYFNNQEGLSEVEELAYNPEVTVRSRGVMEKCTYCVQRIEHARITAKNERRAIRDGEITTACQQSCPTDAIVFGDLNDEHSAVRGRAQEPRSYAVLAELNVKPRTTYMARLRNPNPRLIEDKGHDGDHPGESPAQAEEHQPAAGSEESSHRGNQH